MSEPLHILMPADVFPPASGGSGWSAHALARALQERGHQVTAFLPRARCAFFPTVADPSQGVPAHPKEVLGVPTINVPYTAGRLPVVANWYRHEWLWPLLRNVLVREILRVDAHERRRMVMHGQHVQTVPGAVLARRETGVPVVATVRDHWPRDYFATGLHGDRVPYPRNSWASLVTDLVARRGPVAGLAASIAVPYMLRHVERRLALLAEADAIVTVSRYMARRLPASVPRARVHAIPNLVDLKAVDQVLHQPSTSSGMGRFMLYVGKLEPNKGAHLLPRVMAAARQALQGRPLPPLVIAGTGSLAQRLERELGASGVVARMLPGWTEHDEVLRLMRHAEVLVFPSAWGEPLTRVLLEASAVGACIAAMATGGTPEIVEDGISGVLADKPEELGSAIGALLDDEERRHQLREGARHVARERFAAEVVASRFEALYEQTLEVVQRGA